MPKIHEQKSEKQRAALSQDGGKSQLRTALKGASYEQGAAALGMDPQMLRADPQELGMDTSRLAEEMSTTLKTLQPCYEFFLRTQSAAQGVAADYASKTTAGPGAKDDVFIRELYELITRINSTCAGADFAKNSDLTSRNHMKKAEKREQAAKAQALLHELERMIAALSLFAAQVAPSAIVTREMQLQMYKLLETRTQVSQLQRTYHSEGFEIGSPTKTADPAEK